MRRSSLTLATAATLAAACAAPAAHAQSADWQRIIGAILNGAIGGNQQPQASDLARCESTNNQPVVCNIPNGYRAEYVRTVSQTPCVVGQNMIITSASVTVSGGCRADFRLLPINTGNTSPAPTYPAQNGVSGLPVATEQAIESALRDRLKSPAGEYGTLYEVSLINASTQVLRDGSRSYTGLAHANWGGRNYPLSYSSRIDTAGRVTSADYQYNNPNANTGATPTTSTPAPANWVKGTALSTNARAALIRAIEADYRRQSGVRSVQVVTNTGYEQEMVARSDYRFSGRYGVSINDGNWQTFGYQARIRLGNNAVSELQTGLNP